MVSNSISPLEIKSLDSKKSPKKNKSEDDSFKNEMIENEKKMKKKSVDGREVTAQHSSSRSSKATPSKESASPTKASATTSQKMSTVKGENQEASAAMQEQGPQAIAQTTEASEVGLEMMAELQAASMDAVGLKNKEGKLSLEGMQLVQPQMVQVAPTLTDAAVETPTPETLLSAAPLSIEQKPSDLLSQDFQQDLSGFSAGSDFSPIQNPLVKENSLNQQVFASVLDSKMQTPEQIRDNNVENIISQARAILKDGGGEMKLQLRPEGLGTVDLRVGLQNGQVSVEIITQDQNVKKMFEDSIFDMRGALESQNLKIDTFKVGVSEHYDQMMGQQNGAQQQFEEREFARDFMGQFRNDRQGFRQQGIDSVLNSRSPFSSTPEGLQPATGKNLNGRLNIIA